MRLMSTHIAVMLTRSENRRSRAPERSSYVRMIWEISSRALSVASAIPRAAMTPTIAHVRLMDSCATTCQISALKKENSSASIRMGSTRPTMDPRWLSSRAARRNAHVVTVPTPR